uniref:Pept_C1 domain-containing protein n=1 Tax=Elaeophora elaphi TaxID=1147741 RepID=A0A0R3RJ50_9BILA
MQMLYRSNDDTPGKIHSLYQQHYSKYKKYLKELGKEPDPTVPEPIRLLKFAQTAKFIEEHNERYKKGLVKYELKLNEMSDWTEDEKQRLFGRVPSPSSGTVANLTQLLAKKKKKTIPKKMDYRKKIKTVPVINQGQCGVCYIFSALAALEMYITLKEKKPPVRLSVQEVMDCSGLQRCFGKGGSEDDVFNWVAEHGVALAKSYPYKENNGISCPRLQSHVTGGLAGGVFLPFNNEEVIKKVLALYGPVSVSLHASTESFKSYGKGNWGKSWGQNGYGLIRAGEFTCGIGRSSIIPIFS